uniref:AIG1-type G domain-containing protein n=1 Tax=Amphimedon queenslandica TaxID=400682 RepID=A0A1X7UJ50_AMPQE
MTVLLIGSTGMGKSTFGNFLLDPDEKHMFEKMSQTFATATDNKPMTQEVKIASKKIQIDSGRSVLPKRTVPFTIIDTPGLNESAERDLSHMIDIIRNLNEKEIRACILAVKFNAKIDTQYQATMEYYSKLLPSLFEKNVIIVMTDYATDERSEKMRKKQGINVDDVKLNTILALQQCSNKKMTYAPQLFMIDSLPLDEAEMETSPATREAILSYIFQLQPITFQHKIVAKTDYIRHKDGEEEKKLQGEIDGYNERLKEVNATSKKALDETRNKRKEIQDLESEIKDLEEKLKENDTTEDVVAEHWSINKEWRAFKWLTEDFKFKSVHKITKYRPWTNGKCEFKKIVSTTNEVMGSIEGNFMRGIYASVTAYTEKRIKYADEIGDLKDKMKEKKATLEECTEAWKEFQKLHREKEEEIQLLQKYIDERSIAAKKLHSQQMTLDEAIVRLDKLIKESKSGEK